MVRLVCNVLALALLLTGLPSALAQSTTARFWPANGARNINPDAHLMVTFPSPPSIGASGKITILDALDERIVDVLDMSVPPSPNPTGRSPTADGATRSPPPPVAAGPDHPEFQSTLIGGVYFHFFPIVVRGRTAIIYPHHGVLQY